jgi:hypothetical protein
LINELTVSLETASGQAESIFFQQARGPSTGFSYQSAHETKYKYGMIVENLQLGDLETHHDRRSVRGEL